MIIRLQLLFLIIMSQLFTVCENNKNHFDLTDKDLIIAVDIGHSKMHPGATSSRGFGEYEFNFRMANNLLVKLKKSGYIKSFIINENGDELPLKERIKIAENKNADVILSIHHDSVQPQYLKEWMYNNSKKKFCDKYRGYSILVSKKNSHYKKSYELAKLIGTNLVLNNFKPTFHHTEEIKGENKTLLDSVGIYQYDDLAILKYSNIPAVLIECGIIVNRDEELLLNDKSHTDLICTSISNAIDKYYDNWKRK